MVVVVVSADSSRGGTGGNVAYYHSILEAYQTALVVMYPITISSFTSLHFTDCYGRSNFHTVMMIKCHFFLNQHPPKTKVVQLFLSF